MKIGDATLHCIGAGLIQAVCCAADNAAPGTVWAGVAFNAMFWPGREWLQARDDRTPGWSAHKKREAWAPVLTSLVMAAGWVTGRVISRLIIGSVL